MKTSYIIIAIVIVLALVAVIYLVSASTPVVATGDNVSVYYTGKLTNGTVFDSNVGQTPLSFVVGSGQVITGFDQGVIGMKLNQTKTITIPANEAYGAVNPAMIIQVPISEFGNSTVNVGMTVSQTSNGEQYQGRITAISGGNATVDFNSPLAGQALIFTITIAKIQKG